MVLGTQLNIIFHKIPENNEQMIVDRDRKDKATVTEIITDELHIENITVDNIIRTTRLGAKTGDSKDKPRPIRVTVDSDDTKALILRNARNLRDASEQYRKIGIDIDYTPKQRDEIKTLIREARDKEAADSSGKYLYRVRGPPGKKAITKIEKHQY